MLRAAAVVLLVGSQGCHRDFSNSDANGSPLVDAGDGRTLVASVPVTVNRDLDILFVIDDSPGMLDKQTNLKNNFPSFINVLNTIEGGLPNIHLGVVSTDLGTKGTQDAAAGPGIGSGPGSCSGSGKNGVLQTNGTTLVSQSFITDVKNTDGTRTRNYTGDLATAFSALASLGASGCGFEQPLEAMRRALNNNPSNLGFVRPSANLAVVLFTDEDDCSFSKSTLLGSDTSTLGPLQSFRCPRFGVTCTGGGATSDDMNTVGTKTGCKSNEASPYLEPVSMYKAFFNGLKTNPRQLFAGAISGPASPVEVELRAPPGGGTAIPALAHSCSYSGAIGEELADPGVRVAQLVNSIGQHSLSPICQQDLSGALTDLARKIKLMVGDPCIDATLPLSGLDCVVTEETSAGTSTLPACTASAPPCWEIVSDTVNCAAGAHQKLNIQRTQAPPPETVVSMRCRL